MPKQWLNDPERCLLEKWADARLLEDSMDSVRKKYGQLLGRVLDRVQEKHKELDCREIHVNRTDRTLGIGKKTLWASKKGHTTSGLWIGGIRIDNLMEDEDAPSAVVRINYPKNNIDPQAAKCTLLAKAEHILAKEDVSQLHSKALSEQAEISYPLREPRDKWRDFLLKGDEIAFIDCLAAHFEAMVEFVPVLDDIFQVGEKKGK